VSNFVEIGQELEGIRTKKNHRGPQCIDLNETHVRSKLLNTNPHVLNLVEIGGEIVGIEAKKFYWSMGTLQMSVYRFYGN
jgi:hypothetical protein